MEYSLKMLEILEGCSVLMGSRLGQSTDSRPHTNDMGMGGMGSRQSALREN